MKGILSFNNPILGNAILDNGICINRDAYGFANPHSHSFFELQYILIGGGTYYVNNTKYSVKADDIFFINVGTEHRFELDPGSIMVNLIFESPKIFAKEVQQELSSLDSLIKPSDIQAYEIKHLIFDSENEINNQKKGYQNIVKCNIEKILLLLFRISESKNKQSKANIFFSEIIKYIDDNLYDVTLPQTAKKFNYNVSYFSRIFHQNVGLTFSEYITTAKLSNALQLIITTNKSIEEISSICGFKNHNIFCQKFKYYTQQTPTEYRKHWRERN
ncbi:MAG: AraC family transcriptional regulator [Clostridia bacterium]|nr:AraC family transcriptional regulator [Clostridia bacterium]